MKGALRIIIVVLVICGTLALAVSSLSAAQEFVPGLQISLVNAPDSAMIGETFSMTVVVTKPQGVSVTGRLRTYLYASVNQVSYPLPAEGFTVIPLAVGEWTPNEIYVSLGENDTSAAYTFSLAIDNKVILTGSSAQATLRARFRKTDVNVQIAPDSDKDFFVFPARAVFEIPFAAKVFVTLILVMVLIAVTVTIVLRRSSSELPMPVI